MELEDLKKLIFIPEELEKEKSVQDLVGVFADAFYNIIRDISEEISDDQGNAKMNVIAKHITANVAAKGFVKAHARYLGELADEYNASKEENPDGTDGE